MASTASFAVFPQAFGNEIAFLPLPDALLQSRKLHPGPAEIKIRKGRSMRRRDDAPAETNIPAGAVRDAHAWFDCDLLRQSERPISPEYR